VSAGPRGSSAHGACRLGPALAVAALLACPSARAAQLASAAPGASFPAPAAGLRLILQKGCTNCHGLAGPGGRQGPDLLRTVRGKGGPEILADMWNHVPEMVRSLSAGEHLPTLSAGELRDLVGYLVFVNYLGEPGDSRRGESLLAEMSCLGCHDLRRKGKIGPALVSPRRVASPVGLITDLWNHYPNMSAALRRKGLPWFSWNGSNLTDLSRYLGSLAPVGSPPALQDPGDPGHGVAVFARLGCVRCHDAASRDWSARLRAANRRSAAENGAALLRHLPTVAGAPGRAAQPGEPLSANDMADLLAYLSLAGTEPTGGDAAQGRVVFEHERCAGCHALPGGRPRVGPNVADMPPLASPYEAAALMIAHASNMKTVTEIKQVPWPQVQPEELQDLYAFLAGAPRR
jgi:cytochrome c2